jgi:two-component system sensor histidine kinase UhpB
MAAQGRSTIIVVVGRRGQRRRAPSGAATPASVAVQAAAEDGAAPLPGAVVAQPARRYLRASRRTRVSEGVAEAQQRNVRERSSLLKRVFLVNATILILSAALLALTPFKISVPIAATQAAVLGIGLVVMLAANLALLRRALAPLRELTGLMPAIDLLEPGRRLPSPAAEEVREVASLAESFNAMLERLEFERRDSSRRVLLAQEGERLRIARELHDELGQLLTAIAIEAERIAGDATAEVSQSLARLAEWLHESLGELRAITRDLRPEALDDLGLINAFIALCKRVAEQGGIEVEKSLPSQLPPRAPEVDLVIYRVAQESLTNVMRHSGASRAVVTLSCAGGRILLRVEDDGCGMRKARADESTGIAGMRERALLVGGRLTVGAGPGGGTVVQLEVPFE